MTPYSPERPCGRLVETPTGHTIEWFEKATGDEQPIRFQKDEDDTAISGKKQARNSAKKAKKQAKNRLKAEAAAEAARAKLHKGVDMKDPIIEIAKAVVAGGKPRITKKRDFYRGIIKLAVERYPEEGRPAVRFSKFVTGDDTGRLLLAAMRKADGDEPVTEDGEDPETDDTMPETSGAYDEMMRKARKLAARDGITEAAAFAKVYSTRRDLAEADKMTHLERVTKALGL